MKTFLPLGTGFYQADEPRLREDVELTETATNDAAQSVVKVADNYADDAAAATGGIEIGQLYHNAGAVRIRIA